MNSVLRWLRDPYVHVVMIAALTAWISFGRGAAGTAVHTDVEAACLSCPGDHEPSAECPLVAVRTAAD